MVTLSTEWVVLLVLWSVDPGGHESVWPEDRVGLRPFLSVVVILPAVWVLAPSLVVPRRPDVHRTLVLSSTLSNLVSQENEGLGTESP